MPRPTRPSRTLRDEQTQVKAEERKSKKERRRFLAGRRRSSCAGRSYPGPPSWTRPRARNSLCLAGELRDLERTLADLKAVRQQSQQTFSLVPYRGRRGDNRRPLYVECTADGVVFHPDRLAVTGIDLAPRTIREEVQRRLINQPAGDSPARKPYLLMLVRPNGIASYYRALAALHGLGVDFGYEFIEADWVLDFPQDDSAMVPQPWMTQVTPGTLPPSPRPRTGPVPSRPLPVGMAPSGASEMVADGTPPSNAGAPPTGARSAGNMIATSLQAGSTGSPGAGSGSGPGPGGPFSPGDGNAPGGAAGRGLTGGSPFASGGLPIGVRSAGSAARLEFGAIGPSGAAAGSGPGPGGPFAGGPGGPGGAAGSPGGPGGNALATGGQPAGVGRPGGGTNPYAGSSGQSGFAPGFWSRSWRTVHGRSGRSCCAAGSPGVPGGNAMATGGQSAGVGRPGGGTNPYAGSSGQSGFCTWDWSRSWRSIRWGKSAPCPVPQHKGLVSDTRTAAPRRPLDHPVKRERLPARVPVLQDNSLADREVLPVTAALAAQRIPVLMRTHCVIPRPSGPARVVRAHSPWFTMNSNHRGRWPDPQALPAQRNRQLPRPD